MYCFKCGRELPDDAKFCVICGTAQEEPKEEKICDFCGAEIDPDSAFCPECGNKLIELLIDVVSEMDFSPETSVSVEASAEAAAQDGAKVSPAGAGAGGTGRPAAYRAQAAKTDPLPAHNTPLTRVPEAAAQVAGAAPVVASAAAPVSAAAGTAAAGAAVAGTAAVAGAATASGAAAIGTIATTAAVEVAKGGINAAKRAGIIAVILTFLVSGFSAWLAVFVDNPEGVTEEFFQAAQELDFDTMLSCMDPGTEKQIRAVLNLTGGILGSLTGIDLDLEALASLAPGLVPLVELDVQLSVQSVETVLYSDESVKRLVSKLATLDETELEQYIASQTKGDSNYLSDNAITDFLAEYDLIIPGIAKLTAKSAIVKVVLVVDGETQILFLPLQNEGYGDWRIYLNLNLLSSLTDA